MNTFPCNQNPQKFINCCQVMDCIDIKSSDNSVSVEKNGCGIDLSITSNNIDSVLQLNNGQCIEFTKEFIDGKLVITPTIDWDCASEYVCEICQPPVTCPTPLSLSVEIV